MAKAVTRRDALKASLRAGAYAAPVILAAGKASAGVAAATPGPAADIAVTMNTVPPNNGLLWPITTVTNLGPNTATGVVVSEPVPPGASNASGTASQGTYNAATGLWTVGTLPVGATATLQIAWNITGPWTLIATRTASSPPDPNPANDTANYRAPQV